MFNDFISSMLRPKRLVSFALTLTGILIIFALHFGYAKQLSPDYGETASFVLIVVCFTAGPFIHKLFD